MKYSKRQSLASYPSGEKQMVFNQKGFVAIFNLNLTNKYVQKCIDKFLRKHFSVFEIFEHCPSYG